MFPVKFVSKRILWIIHIFKKLMEWHCFSTCLSNRHGSLSAVWIVQDDREAMLSYSFKVSLSLLQNRKFRRTVHESLVKLYNELGVPDLISICQVSLSVSSLVTDINSTNKKM